jgi:hypothetical protein
LKDLGRTEIRAQNMSISVWMFAVVTSLVVGFGSDWANLRYLFTVVPLIVGVVGYALLVAQQ